MKLILNMIVKNEAKIIERCLNSCWPYIDGAVICDTGSSDDTIKIIKDYFLAFGKPVTIGICEFRDFSYARNNALELAKREYPNEALLFMDAGMVLEEIAPGSLDPFDIEHTPHLTLTRVSNNMQFVNTHIVHSQDAIKWEGVCHEFLATKSPPTHFNLAKVICNQDGGNQTGQPERYLQMLQDAYDAGDRGPRNVFYLAQSYREIDRYEEAIKYYEERITLGAFDEEIWYSKWKRAWCKWALGQNIIEVYEAYVDAYTARMWRLEPVRDLVQFLKRNCPTKMQEIVILQHLLKNAPKPNGDMLFVENDCYEN